MLPLFWVLVLGLGCRGTIPVGEPSDDKPIPTTSTTTQVTSSTDDTSMSTTTTSSTTETSTTSTSTTTETSTTSTSTTTPEEPMCPEDPDLWITSLSSREGPIESQMALDITVSKDASLAVRCTANEDPDERHLFITGTRATHAIEFSGLLTDTTYLCDVAPVCPKHGDALESISFTTGLLPRDLPAVDIESTEERSGYMLTHWTNDGACGGRGVTSWYDTDGHLRHWFDWTDIDWWIGCDVEALMIDPETYVVGGGGLPTSIVDLWDGLSYMTDLVDPGWWYHHDGKEVFTGDLLTLESVDNNVGDMWWEGFRLRLHDPLTGMLNWEWDSQHGVDQGALATGSGDVYHANWVDYIDGPSGPTGYVSLCTAYQIIAVDPVSNEVKWVFGPDGGFDLYDTAGNPLPDSEYTQCQHGLEMQGNRLLVYDNGWGRGYSRATEYELNPTERTATLLWTWTEPEWWEGSLGDVDYLDNGNVLITQAHPSCWAWEYPDDKSAVVEINPETGEVPWRATFTSTSDAIYRAELLDGCSVFHNTRHCDALAKRDASLDDLFTR